jgi:hypothetical protein
MIPIFYGCVERGVVHVDHRDRMRSYLMSLDGERVVVTVQKAESGRTINQNRYYWLIVRIVGDHCGYSASETHTEIKKRFGITSSAAMTLEEFSEYVERVVAWAQTDLGLTLPAPDEVR